MVEKIIERCLEQGIIAKQKEGKVYCINDEPEVHCVSGTVANKLGLHIRTAAQIVKSSQALGLDAYLIDVENGQYSKTNSVLGIVCMSVPKGRRIAVAANHGTDAVKLMELYRAITKEYAY